MRLILLDSTTRRPSTKAKSHQAANDMANDKTVTFSRHEVACLIAFIRQSGGSFSMKEWTIMSKIDGNKTPSSYDHSFRALKSEADEIVKKIQSGALDNVATPSTKNPKGASAKTTPVRPRAPPPKKAPAKRGKSVTVSEPILGQVLT